VLSGSCCWDARVEAVIVARMVLVRHAAPLAVLVTVAAVDVIAGRDQVVLGLVVIAPLVAANMLGRGATVGYGVLALFVAALLGVYDQQYNADTVVAQLVRLVGVALGAGAALVGCGLRLQREAELAVQERARTADLPVRRLAETLQRSLLTDPPALPGLQLVVRYRPASVDVLVGGDWYDAFPRPDGTVVAVIGDVAGHDGPAAAMMAQLRGVLRGIVQADTRAPGKLLAALDCAVRQLSLPILATLIVATIIHRPRGTLVCWSNAGHPPPLLIRSSGPAQLLHTAPELLVGVDAWKARTDHEITLHRGDTLLLYTDGLVERRSIDLDDGLAGLQTAADGLGRWPLSELVDRLLTAVPGQHLDDVALLAIRACR
jgi:hypothetical protein